MKSRGSKIHKIDASGKSVGRIATEVVIFLRGKNRVDFAPNLDRGDKVVIENASKLKFTGKKLEQKQYIHHSGYPGGLKKKGMKEVGPEEIIRRAVWNMLPKNKLRDVVIKRLVVMR